MTTIWAGDAEILRQYLGATGGFSQDSAHSERALRVVAVCRFRTKEDEMGRYRGGVLAEYRYA